MRTHDGSERAKAHLSAWLVDNELATADGHLTALGKQVLVAQLRMLEQPWTREIMEAMAANLPVITHELVILRGSGNDAEALLVKRPDEPKDPWRGALHMVGTVFRVTDRQAVADRRYGTVGGFDAVTDRLVQSELPGCRLERAAFINERFTPGDGRPLSIQRIHVGWLATGSRIPSNAKWYPVRDLLRLEARGTLLGGHAMFVVTTAFLAGVITYAPEVLG
jgi:hypothetical protein